MSVRVLSQVFEHSESTGGARLVLLVLADAAHDDGITWISQQDIARKARVDERTVRRTTDDLEAAGEIQIRKAQRGRRRINVYRVMVDGLAKPLYPDLPFTLKEPFDDRTSRPAVVDDDRTSHPTTTGHLIPNQGAGLLIGTVIDIRKVNPSATAAAVTGDVADLDPPKAVQINGRNVPLDTLCEVCGIDPASPKVRTAATALGDQTKPKIPGIRSLFWIECKRVVETHPELTERLLNIATNADEFEQALADRIRVKAASIAAAYTHLPITPHVVRDYWLDVELSDTRDRPGRPTLDEIKAAYGE